MRAEVLPDISPGERDTDDWDVPTFLRRQSD